MARSSERRPGDHKLVARAMAAYYRTAAKTGETVATPSPSSFVVTGPNELPYVVLRKGKETLAVYRVQNSGQLRRLVGTRLPTQRGGPTKGDQLR